jgi:uncharacterized protein YraI
MNSFVKRSTSHFLAGLGPFLQFPALLIVAGLMVTAVAACGGDGQVGPAPSAAITEPISGSKFQVGEEVIVQGVAAAPEGIIRLELWANGALSGGMSTPSGQAEQSFAAAMRWVPASPGQYTLEVRGISAEQKAVASASVTVTVEQGAAPPTATPVAQPTQPGCTPSATARSNVNVQAGPGTGYAVLGTLSQGQSAQIIGRDAGNAWWQIKFGDGLAWVSAQYVDTSCTENVPVVNPPGPTPTVSINFRADSTTIKAGECTTIRWDVDNTKAVYVSDGQREMSVPPHGSAQVCPGQSTTYVLRVTRQDNVDERQEVRVTVETGPGTVSFRVDNQQINLGDCTIVRWDVDNASKLYLDLGSGERQVDGHGSAQVCPTQTSTYKLRVQWRDGSETSHQVTVSVSGSQPVVYSFSLDRSSIYRGECATLSWRVEKASAVYLDGQGVAGQDSRQVCPVTDTTYTLTVRGYDNSQRDYQATLQVQQVSPVVEFRADPTEVAPTDCSTLIWSVQNAKEVYLDGASVALQSTRQVCPQSDTTYTLTVRGYDNSQRDYQVTVRVLIVIVTPTINIYASPTEITAGECSTLYWNVSHGTEFYLNGESVGQSGNRQVCPTATTAYTLRAIALGTMPNEQSVVVSVVQP